MKSKKLLVLVLMLAFVAGSIGLGFKDAYAVEYSVYVYYIENDVEMPVNDADIRFSWMSDQEWSNWIPADNVANGIYTWDSPAEFYGDPWRIRLNNGDWDPVTPGTREYLCPVSMIHIDWEVEVAP